MVRITTTITLDYEVFKIAREKFDNLSGALNDFLKLMLEQNNPEAKEIFDVQKMRETAKRELADLRAQSKKEELKLNAVKEKAAKDTEPMKIIKIGEGLGSSPTKEDQLKEAESKKAKREQENIDRLKDREAESKKWSA